MSWNVNSWRPWLLGPALVVAACTPAPAPEPMPPPPGPAPTIAPAPASSATVETDPLAPAQPDAVSHACSPYDQKIATSYIAYLDAFSNEGQEISPDGRRLLFRSNRGGGTHQLYLGSMVKPDATPTLIAPSPERVGGARFTPDGKFILFVRDKDHNENFQLYRATGDGSRVTPLTQAPQWFHHPPWVSPNSKTLYYFRGIHKDSKYELVSQSVQGGAAKLLFQGSGFHVASDLSHDGSQILVSRFVSLSQSELILVDVKTGTTKRLAPSKDTKAHAHSGVFSGDGKSIYYITDEGSDRAGVRRIDAKKGNVLASFTDESAEVLEVLAPRAGGAIAVALDFGSHQKLQFSHPVSLKKMRDVKLPLGRVSLGRFTRDGGRLLITVSDPSTPTDTFAVSMRTGRVKALRADTRKGLDKLEKVSASTEKVSTFDQLKVPVNVYLPKKLKKNERRPVLVKVHGGPASSSTIDWDPLSAFFISRGYVVVEPNVRGSTGFGKAYEKADNGRLRLDSVKDLGAVNAWIRQQSWADPDKIVVFGGSYGGYMTYMALGHQPQLWRAGIGLVGVVNLRTFLKNTTGAIRLVFREEFGELDKDGPFLDSVSPIQVVDRIRVPLFVYQGATDPRVPRSEQDQLVRALRKRGLAMEYMVANDEGHSLSHRHNKLEFIGRVHRFLDHHLGRGGLPPGCR